MGNSSSLGCCPNESGRQRREVLVIKEDGDSLRFKDGILVKDILSAYPYHKIIKCSSERTALPDETRLSCNCLYFLLPVGLALSEAAYQSLVRSAASQNMGSNKTPKIKIRENNQQGKEKGNGSDRQDYTYHDYNCSQKWKPVLRTIPETPTPS